MAFFTYVALKYSRQERIKSSSAVTPKWAEHPNIAKAILYEICSTGTSSISSPSLIPVFNILAMCLAISVMRFCDDSGVGLSV